MESKYNESGNIKIKFEHSEIVSFEVKSMETIFYITSKEVSNERKPRITNEYWLGMVIEPKENSSLIMYINNQTGEIEFKEFENSVLLPEITESKSTQIFLNRLMREVILLKTLSNKKVF